MQTTDPDHNSIARIVEQFRDAFARLDLQIFASAWDRSDALV